MTAQINILDEIIVDNFAGGGGASTGMELATGRPVTIAINHDPDAIAMHRTNHPYTTHYQASVWDVDPKAVCAGRPVGLAWFSPDCKHFSKAKGAALVDRNIRGLAWIVLRWAGTVRPAVIILENVEEFQTWGPVRKGKPVKSKSGQTFRRWLSQLQDLGYAVEHRELVAADYGTPTTRKRFFLIARCDGRPIVWPEPTHAPRGSDAVKRGEKQPWRAAAEIIDWTQPCYSVFATRQQLKEIGVTAVRPLADNTMRRVIRGVDKFTIRSGRPFIVECNHSGGGHLSAVETPIGTVTQKHTAGVCRPVLAPHTVSNTNASVGAPAADPIHTVTSAGNQLLVAPSLMQIGQTGGGDRIRSVMEPTATAVSKAEACIVAPSLIQYHTEQSEALRGQAIDAPVMTVDGSNRYGLTAAQLVEYFGNGMPLDVTKPLHTVTSHDREAMVSAHIQKYFDGGYKGCGDPADAPLSTVTATPRHGVCAAHIVKFKAAELGTSPAEPLPTITAQSCSGGYAECRTVLARTAREDLGHWPEIRDLLNRHCGYDLAEDEVLMLDLFGSLWYIRDIGLRMLTPRELYNGMGFPPDYIIDRDCMGNEYGKKKQVARCGNAVCPQLAAALVRANRPDWCRTDIHTMADLEKAVAL